MDILLNQLLDGLPTLVLALIIAVMLFILGKGADLLVDQAVKLSLYWGVPEIIIGATIISIGTTLPEASVSVLAAVSGQSGLSLGNGIGSVIANTGLILGITVILGKIPIDRKLVNRQGFIMVAANLAIVMVSLPFLTRTAGGTVSRFSGFVFVALLFIYIYTSIKWSRKGYQSVAVNSDLSEKPDHLSILPTLFKMAGGIAAIIVSSKILISSVEITAVRIGIPQSVIASTLIAFGTSLPELILALQAIRKGHGELALGNIVGANILNILFVIGVSAAVTSGGLSVPAGYYSLQYPALLIMMSVFTVFTRRHHQNIHKAAGYLLFGLYILYLLLNYL